MSNPDHCWTIVSVFGMSFAQTYTRHYFQIMEFKPKFSYKLFGGGETLRRRQGEERKELKSRNSHKPVSIHESSLKYERQKKTEGKKMHNDKERVKKRGLTLPAKLEPHLIGIQNRGNTCYLNSTVQALLGLPMLVTDAGQSQFYIC